MYSILIVDDEPIVKIALRSILPWEEHGFSICGTASNGLEALPLIEQHHPDVIITDLKMPGMDGLELIRTLKEKNCPGEILVLSNYEDFDSVRSALLLGAADYLLKIKIQPDTLLACLNKTVEKLKDRAPRHLETEKKDQNAGKKAGGCKHQSGMKPGSIGKRRKIEQDADEICNADTDQGIEKCAQPQIADVF